jgi:hypothetical protein
LTTYKLEFHEAALKEWRKLGATVQEQFKAKLKERPQEPRIPGARLSGPKERYKIKQRCSCFFDRFAARFKVDLGFVPGCFLLFKTLGHIGLVWRQDAVGRVGSFGVVIGEPFADTGFGL